MYRSHDFRDEFNALTPSEQVEILRLLKEIDDDPYIGHRAYEAEEPTLYFHGSQNWAIAYRLRAPRYTEPSTDPVPTALAMLRTPTPADFLRELRQRGLIP